MMLRSNPFAVLLLVLLSPVSGFGQAGSPDPDGARPIDALDSVWIEALTWMEVRDAIRGGKTTALVATGGIEQNGPYLATGKHNVILRATAEAVARNLGNALVASVVPFVPEGEFDPPTGHMRYPGTVGVTEETFRALLTDIGRSLRASGFENIVFFGDSGGNQDGMAAVAASLSNDWAGSGAQAHFIPEYYDNPRWNAWIRDRGVEEIDQGLHDDLRHTSIMALVDPESVRWEQRKDVGLLSINGVDLAPMEETIALARGLVAYQASVTAEAIRRSLGG
jgi:creatinine amidohydrolase/Fe(II)-dependent formamide hydrolase-like protein